MLDSEWQLKRAWAEALAAKTFLDGKLVAVCGPNPQPLGHALAGYLSKGEPPVFVYCKPPSEGEIESMVDHIVGAGPAQKAVPVVAFDFLDPQAEPPFLEEFTRRLKQKRQTVVITWRQDEVRNCEDLPDGLTFHVPIIVQACDLSGGIFLKNTSGLSCDFFANAPRQ